MLRRISTLEKHLFSSSLNLWRDLEAIVVPFIHDHHLMFQHDNATAPCCKDLYTLPGSWKHPSSCTASILTGHVTHWACWDALDRRIRQRVPVPANIQQLHTAIEEKWPTLHRPQSQPDQLYVKEMWLHCVKQIVVTPDTDPPPPQYSKLLHCRVVFYCGQPKSHLLIIMLSNHHLDMSHLWGGWLVIVH